MTNIVEPKIPAGFLELLPSEQIIFNKYLDLIRETYEEYGFAPLDTPLLEFAEVLMSKSGEETERQIYQLTKGDDKFALRFDLTVPLARFVAMNSQNITFPFRRYQIGKVYRGEKPQKGRFREFYQCDIDIIGDGSLSLVNDAEIPSVIYRLFTKMQLGDFVIRINNRKILNGFVRELGFADKEEEVLRVVDKLEKVSRDEIIKELIEAGLSLESSEKVLEFISMNGNNSGLLSRLKAMDIKDGEFALGVQELEEVVTLAYRFGVPETSLAVDLTIARGLAYYTGTVYETKMKNEQIVGSVCSGGRYDNLAEKFTDRKLPGVGISIGMSRLFSQLKTAGLINVVSSTPANLLVIPMERGQIEFALEVANETRKNKAKVEVYMEEDKFKKKMIYANRIQVPFVAIIGGNEVERRMVSLKNMQTGEQSEVTMDQVANLVR